MDYGKVLGRAWEITWRWKVLWILGFLASLGSGGGGGGGSNAYTGNGGDFNIDKWTQGIPPGDFLPAVSGIIGIIIAVVCVLFIIFIALWVVSVIARGGLIAGVQQVEDEGSTTFRTAWVAGRKKFWTLFGLGILAAIPMIILIFAGIILLGLGIAAAVGAMDISETAGIAGIVMISLLCGGFLCCGMIILGIVLEQIRVYGERAAILEDLGWINAFKRGWQVLKENLGPTIIFWLIFLAIGIVIFVISFAIIAALAAPFLLLLLPSVDPGTWLIVPACFAGLVMVIVFALIKSVVTTFSSATWTLAYREMTGKELQVAGQE
ncbi:MAG: hypothetical protein WBF05_15350 [Anaerolineales bacterium]